MAKQPDKPNTNVPPDQGQSQDLDTFRRAANDGAGSRGASIVEEGLRRNAESEQRQAERRKELSRPVSNPVSETFGQEPVRRRG